MPLLKDFHPDPLYGAIVVACLAVAIVILMTLRNRAESRRVVKAARLDQGRSIWLHLTDSIYKADARMARAEQMREWLSENAFLFSEEQVTVIEGGIEAACTHQANLLQKVGLKSWDRIENARQVINKALARVEK
jgi:hypothetical protein